LVDGLVDPHGLGQQRRLGWLADEPLWVRQEGAIQDGGSGGDDLAGAAVVDVGRGEQRDPEKPLAEGAGWVAWRRRSPVSPAARSSRYIVEGEHR
jgi:hypothetical protein